MVAELANQAIDYTFVLLLSHPPPPPICFVLVGLGLLTGVRAEGTLLVQMGSKHGVHAEKSWRSISAGQRVRLNLVHRRTRYYKLVHNKLRSLFWMKECPEYLSVSTHELDVGTSTLIS